MEKALKAIQEMNQNPDFILKYNTALDELQGEREEAHKEGLNDGISIGREEGCKDERIEIAKNLLNNGIDEDIILKSTNISKEQLEELKKYLIF